LIYLDTSVALAQLLAEDRRPPAEMWEETLVASRLLEYEMWNRLHARDIVRSHGDALRLLLARVAFVEMSRTVLARALQPFPAPVRTLDALHLASAAYLREHGATLSLATYDGRMRETAVRMGFSLYLDAYVDAGLEPARIAGSRSAGGCRRAAAQPGHSQPRVPAVSRP
jgi:predicted nucleic acid-binding protein